MNRGLKDLLIGGMRSDCNYRWCCDRCGKTTFKEETGAESTFTDGIIKEESIYEDAKDWAYIYPEMELTHGKLLCPECSKSFDVVMKKFMNLEI